MMETKKQIKEAIDFYQKQMPEIRYPHDNIELANKKYYLTRIIENLEKALKFIEQLNGNPNE